MMLAALALVAVALGHLGLSVLIFNTSHGLGLAEAPMRRLGRAVALVSLSAAAALAWLAWTRPLAGWPPAAQLYAAVCAATALVLVPASSLWLRLRPQPGGREQVVRELDLANEPEVGGGVGDGPLAWMLRLPGNESLRLRVASREVEVPGLPAALEGLSILHLSDLHLAPAYTRGYFEAVADTAARLEADLVLFTGDLIEHESAHAWVAPVLERVRGRLGSFAILGNHDYPFEPDRIRDEIRRAGFDDVDGRWCTIEVDGIRVALGGTSAPWGPQLDPAAMPPADFRLVLSHTPDLFYRAAGWGADLVLAGHNHGGQIRLPGVGPVVMPSRYSRRFDRGLFARGRTRMVVSVGVGSRHPIRYGCPPQVDRLVLLTPKPVDGTSRPARRETQGVAGPSA